MASNANAHVVIRSATKFQAPSSRCYKGDLAKAGHLTIKLHQNVMQGMDNFL